LIFYRRWISIAAMKKRITIVSGFLLLLVAFIYLFIPETLHVVQTTLLKGNQHGVYRALVNTDKWEKWFPKEHQAHLPSDSIAKAYQYNQISFRPSRQLFDGMEVYIEKNNIVVPSVIIVEGVQIDSAAIQWKFDIATGWNPYKRMQHYLYAKKVQGTVASVMEHLKRFLENRQHVYDLRIEQEKVKDTFLVTLKSVLPRYPETATIYSMIGRLNKYIRDQHAEATNYPMMHVQQLDSNRYETMVAVPVNSKLPDHPPILFKRMVAGNILVADVKGGRENINNAFRKLEDYVEDYKKVSPALPFESLVTNRLAMPDTARWMTKIYYPIY
jgi:hypothetical protein